MVAPWLLAVFFVSVGVELPGSERGWEREDLATLLERGLNAFRVGDYRTSFGYLERARRGYGEDPDYRERGVDRLLLPLLGQAAYHMGEWQDVRETFEEFLRMSPDGEHRPQVLWMLATAMENLGEEAEADRLRERFEAEYPDRAETHLVHLQRALARLGGEDAREGLRWLRRFAQDPERPVHFRVKARLRAIRVALDQGSLGTARILLLEEPWELDQMPELAALAFVAMEIGDQLWEAGEPEAAVRAYRLIPPQRILLALQQERLAEMETRLLAWEPIAGAHPLRSYYRGILEGVRAGEKRLRESADYTPGLWLRLASALSAAGRPREAWLLLEELVLAEETPNEARSEAHYRWIFVAVEMERWSAARILAQTFLEREPDSPRTPSALFLLSGILQEVGELQEASAILADLVVAYPGHPMRGRWAFGLGHLQLQFGFYPEAKRSFRTAVDSAPPQSWLSQLAAMWLHLVPTYEGDYRMAYEGLNDLLKALPETAVARPEILFRLAMVCRSLGEIPEAFFLLEKAGQSEPTQPLLASIHALQGDLLMEEGRLQEALQRFAQIPPDETLFDYATFQRAAIHRTRGDWESLMVTLLDYLEIAAEGRPGRRVEALHGIGLALQRMGREEEIEDLYVEGLTSFGNDPDEPHVGLLLDALVGQRVRQGEDPEDWLRGEMAAALAREEILYWSRVVVAWIRRTESEGKREIADPWLEQLADHPDRDQLDPEALARIGWWWFEGSDPRGLEVLAELATQHPQSPHRGYAMVAHGEACLRKGDLSGALRWFRRMEQELPAHPLSFRAGMGLVRTLRLSGDWEAAQEQVRELLTLPSGRGRGHAEALWEMVLIEEARGDRLRATGYAQRLAALHRGERDLVAMAHQRAAAFFEESGDWVAAHARWEVLARDDWPEDAVDRDLAIRERDRIAALLTTMEPEAPSL